MESMILGLLLVLATPAAALQKAGGGVGDDDIEDPDEQQASAIPASSDLTVKGYYRVGNSVKLQVTVPAVLSGAVTNVEVRFSGAAFLPADYALQQLVTTIDLA